MKYLFISLLFLSLISCGTAKKTVANKANEETASDDKTIGVVNLKYDGCPAMLEVTENGRKVMFYPVNLDESEKIQGLTIKFNYTVSRAAQPELCALIYKVVALENVEVVK